MSQQDELSKKEEERINRTLNKVGKRAAPRPVSWNVAVTPGLNTTTSFGRKDGAYNIKALQEQLREEERKQAQQAQHVNPGHPQYVLPQPTLQQRPISPPAQAPTLTSKQHHDDYYAGTGALPSGDPDIDAEKDKRMRQEEERLERQMRKGGWKMDERRTSIDEAPDHVAIAGEAVRSTTQISGLSARFQDQITQAAKALRQRKLEDVVKRSFDIVATAKAIAELSSDDSEILSHAKALEAGASTLRTNLDSGGDGQQHHHEISGYLGQIFVAVVGAL